MLTNISKREFVAFRSEMSSTSGIGVEASMAVILKGTSSATRTASDLIFRAIQHSPKTPFALLTRAMMAIAGTQTYACGAAPFHDGLTDDWEEDVDCMYMPLVYYLDRYFKFVKVDWDEQYVRPPYIDGFENHWTLEKQVTGEKSDGRFGKLET
ncbi:hypothetical protein E4U11_006206 [Claviceps purpurea]|nr:hypothetical protein E4U11_006206 [Claviceps purpurea]